MIDGMTRKSKTEQVAKSVRTLLGGLVLLLGVVAIPYPGPGWLIVLRDLPYWQEITRLLNEFWTGHDTGIMCGKNG